jgi:hypothetical protein
VVTSVNGARLDAQLEDLGPQFAECLAPRAGPGTDPALAAPARHRRHVHALFRTSPHTPPLLY